MYFVHAITGVTLVICICSRQTMGLWKSEAWIMEQGRIIRRGHPTGMVYVLHHLWQFSWFRVLCLYKSTFLLNLSEEINKTTPSTKRKF